MTGVWRLTVVSQPSWRLTVVSQPSWRVTLATVVLVEAGGVAPGALTCGGAVLTCGGVALII